MAGYARTQGAKPKPTALKQLSGTLRPGRVNTEEPEVELLERPPRCPSHLTGEARKCWTSTARKLIAMGVLADGDLTALEVYSTIYERWKDALGQLARTGPVIMGRDDWFHPNPYLRIINDCQKQMRGFMTEFGITPSSRSRVRAPYQPAKEVDPFEEFLHRDRGAA